MSRNIIRTPKTPEEEAQEEKEYIAFQNQWETDNKKKPTKEDMDRYWAAEKAKDMRVLYPAPRYGGVDRGFAGQSARHRAIQASNRGRRETEALMEKRAKLGSAIEQCSVFIETANKTLASERERCELLLGINDENLDHILQQIHENQKTWDGIDAPKPTLLKKRKTHDRFALKTYILDNRRMSDVIREFMNGEDTIRKLIREMGECRDGGLKFLADIDSNPDEHGRDNADGMSIPQPEVLLEYKSCVEAKLIAWRRLLDTYTKTYDGSMQLTFQELVTYRQNWKEMRKAEIRANIEASKRAAEDAQKQQVAKRTYVPVRHSDGVLSIRREKSPPARKPARNPDSSPAARGPPRQGDASTHELDEAMRNLNTHKPRSMHALLLELKTV